MCPDDFGKLKELVFAGPGGPYEVVVPLDKSSLEDQPIDVVTNGSRDKWFVQVDEVDASGARRLSGMTREGSGLWFELILTNPAQLQYWGDRELVRADLEVCASE